MSFPLSRPIKGTKDVMLIFCLWPCCNALQNEKCKFFVVTMKTAEKYSCFRIMDGKNSICSSRESTSSCEIHYRNGYMCLKWPADIELNCVSDSLEILNGNKKCALEQKCESKSSHCSFSHESKDSVSTLSMSIPLTAACAVMAIIHWMALLDY
ncbi:hypothetical protein ABG768_004781 [Culter alburnus]|uniref:Uncharacterized protein n=1 Tax=Culter alburnus TaxID=194366 RepID=A0AAW1ZWI3_CULAL